MTKSNELEIALSKFEEASNRHAEATEQGNYKIGNKCYAVILEAVTFLKVQNEIQRLTQFLKHPSVGVRMWAATYLLPEKEGIKVLEQIAKGIDIHSLTAKTTLSEWEKGNQK